MCCHVVRHVAAAGVMAAEPDWGTRAVVMLLVGSARSASWPPCRAAVWVGVKVLHARCVDARKIKSG